MEAPSSFACSFPSGQTNFSDQYTEKNQWGSKDVDLYNPCFARLLAELWEKERDHCAQGHLDVCLGYAVASRLAHIGTAILNTTSVIFALPICCCGTGISTGAFCFSACLYKVASCYETSSNSDSANNVRRTAEKARRFAANVFINSLCYSGALVATGALDSARLPANILFPELVNLGCYQHETYLFLNNRLQYVDYMEDRNSPTPTQLENINVGVTDQKPLKVLSNITCEGWGEDFSNAQ
jgi:hypothetical protein